MRTLLSLILLFTSHFLLAQSTINSSEKLQKAREQVENSLRNHLSQFYFTQGSLGQNFNFLNDKNELQLEDGSFSKIQYLDESGFPTFYTTNNKNAAITTGAAQLQPGGRLGLNLTGKGFIVGIIDQTRPKANHIEFGDRLTQKDGSTENISTHSTHVTGTILAAGVNAQAKGMAYEATGWAFNWESDVSKMLGNSYDPISKPDGMLVSNHSYSIVLGWTQNSTGWVWAGNPSVDENEDYRFGFYSSKSQSIDELLYSRPYYTVVWSAGNDRSDKGDGTRDPDGPEDTIGPDGVSKNNLTIGAVESVLDYSSTADVKMSSFSSWGPTDDGRIKPDLVAMGVGVFSSSVNNGTDSYSSLNGTSMSAPNVTGSLLLLQQLYSQRNAGRFMLSSALKALSIQTSREAGTSPGPDYIYGWGLLNVEDAAKIILEEDGSSKFIQEEILEAGHTNEFSFISDGVTPIKATLVWTDPAGTPAGVSLDPDKLMLVNDLDLRIFDEDGTEYFPWTLDPSKGVSAKAERNKDNFRDNVEQIVIDSPSPKKYRVVVSHKGELEFDIQQYALVFTAGTSNGSDETLYWIGSNSGNWNDGANWSTTATGPAANKIPGEGTRVVFEGSAGGNVTVNFPANASAFSLNLFGNQLVSFDLKGNQLQLSNGLRVSNQVSTFSNGAINFINAGDNPQIIEVGQAAFSQTNLDFSSGSWQIIDADQLDILTIGDASVSFSIKEVGLNSLVINGAGKIEGAVDVINFQNNITISTAATIPENLNLVFEGNAGILQNSAPINIGSVFAKSGKLELASGGLDELMISTSEVLLGIDKIEINSLDLGPSSILNLGTSGELVVLESISSSATSGAKALITAGSKGKITYDTYQKYCFENVNVSNVDLEGEAIVNLGTGSTVSNASGWLQQNCDEVLFANFETSFNCAGAAVSFDNLSEGSIDSYTWQFGSLGTSSLENPIFVFPAAGTYIVTLRIANGAGFTEFEKAVVIEENTLQQPIIVVNGSTLTSQQPGSSYQWYQNGVLIEGATNRSYEASNDGIYQVAIFNEDCNRISEPVVISAIPDQEVELSRFGIFIGPNPFVSNLRVMISNEYRGQVNLRVYDMTGHELVMEEINKNYDDLEVELGLNGSKGIYILQIETNNLTLHKKLIKN